jgi:hypothetical protein
MLTHISNKYNTLWHVDPVLDNDCETKQENILTETITEEEKS